MLKLPNPLDTLDITGKLLDSKPAESRISSQTSQHNSATEDLTHRQKFNDSSYTHMTVVENENHSPKVTKKMKQRSPPMTTNKRKGNSSISGAVVLQQKHSPSNDRKVSTLHTAMINI